MKLKNERHTKQKKNNKSVIIIVIKKKNLIKNETKKM